MASEIRVEVTEEKGRHLVAQRGFEAGEVVVAQWPYAAVLFNEHVPNFCNRCFRPGSNLRRCARSKFGRYCSKEHQLRDWQEGYKLECEFLVKCSPRVPPAGIRLAAHVAWRRKKELEEGKEGEFWNSYAAVESLMDHWDQLSPERMKSFAEMGFFISKICPHLPEELSLEEPLPQSLARLLAKFAVNNHTISSSSVTSLGCGVYPLLAMANHSSWPNCIQRFNGKRCEFRAIRPINPGDEITITYVDLISTSVEMHAVLKKDYFFDLVPPSRESSREKVLRIDETLEARIWKKGQPPWLLNEKDISLTKIVHNHSESSGGLMILVYETTNPQKTNAEKEKQQEKNQPEVVRSLSIHLWGDWIGGKTDVICIAKRMQLIQEAYTEAQFLYDRRFYKDAAEEADKLVAMCSECIVNDYFLAEQHIVRIRALDLLHKATVDGGTDWGLALKCHRLLIEQHDVLYPEFWSERGTQLAALAKLEGSFGQLKSALKTAEKAIRVLRVTDGAGDVLEEMKKLANNVQCELNFRNNTQSDDL